MVFSSLIFLYAFFALNLFLCFVLKAQKKDPIKKQNICLLIFSLVFYAWGGPVYLLVLCGEVLISWYSGLCIEGGIKGENKKAARHYLAADIFLMLLSLCAFKYLGFIRDMTGGFFGLFPNMPTPMLPIGISFYTFQLISYDVDVYKERVGAQKNFFKLLLYAGLFHQCVAGPIVRYESIAEEINIRHADAEDIYCGIRRFSVGLAKKAILANSAAAAADELLPGGAAELAGRPVLGLWLGMLFFTLQIYFDFSAYSDMAIGMGRMLGFHYDENFNYPYIASTVQDFWRRWHISLSSFFRDYVYIPLGGSREGWLKYVRNMFIVWALTGLWHGASLNYVFWGLYFFVLLLLEKFILKNRPIPVLSRILTAFAIIIGWVIFRFEDLVALKTVLLGMLGFGGQRIYDISVKTVFFKYIFFLIFSLIALTPLGQRLSIAAKTTAGESRGFLIFNGIIEMLLPLLLLIAASLALAGDSYNPFLYFRF